MTGHTGFEVQGPVSTDLLRSLQDRRDRDIPRIGDDQGDRTEIFVAFVSMRVLIDHGAVENDANDVLIGEAAGAPCVPVEFHLAPGMTCPPPRDAQSTAGAPGERRAARPIASAEA